MDAAIPIFSMEGVCKRYGGVQALEEAALNVHGGRVHAVLGENGAGKSTLIKVMAGVVTPDKGRMTLEGREVSFADPAAAMKTVPDFGESVAERTETPSDVVKNPSSSETASGPSPPFR